MPFESDRRRVLVKEGEATPTFFPSVAVWPPLASLLTVPAAVAAAAAAAACLAVFSATAAAACCAFFSANFLSLSALAATAAALAAARAFSLTLFSRVNDANETTFALPNHVAVDPGAAMAVKFGDATTVSKGEAAGDDDDDGGDAAVKAGEAGMVAKIDATIASATSESRKSNAAAAASQVVKHTYACVPTACVDERVVVMVTVTVVSEGEREGWRDGGKGGK